MIKRAGLGNGQVQVTFEVDAAVQADRANLCGEFNDWSQSADEMERKSDGGFTLTKSLDGGRAYRFRYYLDGLRWENDWAADDYVPNEYGGDDSVVDLTNVAGDAPPPVKKASAAKKAGAAKKAAPVKAAGAKVAGAKAPAKKEPAAKKAAGAKKAAKKAAPGAE
ncbi:MAG: hypothetical protein QOG64_809 [Acidimicrobiaceae bacterium]|nr:hypothetical protein [Acidimicrobiaceae bacterium]